VILEGESGDRLQLELLGYQFPTLADEPDDSNWLNVRVSARNGGGAWSGTEPVLQTGEVAKLADWLDAVAAGTESEHVLGFRKPNLSFEHGGEPVRLRAWFELESRPEWAPAAEAGEHDLCVELDVDPDDVRAAAASLRSQLGRFPSRVT
jgi:hypothetical protein